MDCMNVGLQLYSVRSNMAMDVNRTLRQVARIGYEGVEFAGYYDFTAQKLKNTLHELNLQTIGSHILFQQLRDHLQEEMTFSKEIGGKYLVCPYLEEQLRTDEASVDETVHWLNLFGERVTENGLTFAYHNHSFEFEQQINGASLYERLINGTEQKHLKLEFDVCWSYYVGADPISYLHKLSGRVPLVHIKDLRVENGVPKTVPLGEGEIDLEKIIYTCEEVGVEWMIVEQDTCEGDPLDAVERSFNWLNGRYSL